MVGHNVLVHCDCCVICCGLYYGSLSGCTRDGEIIRKKRGRAVMQHGTARDLQDPPPGSYFILQGQTARYRIGRKGGGGDV